MELSIKSVLVHQCFDPATEEKPDACGCRHRISNTERESLLRNGAAASLEQWGLTQEIAMLPGEYAKRFKAQKLRRIGTELNRGKDEKGKDKYGDTRKRGKVSPPTVVMPPQPDDGPVLYIRVDTTPIYSKEPKGCGHVPLPVYMTCSKCEKKLSVGRDLLAYARLCEDGTMRVNCPHCGAKDEHIVQYVTAA